MGICSQALHLVVSSEAKAVQLNSLHNSISQDALAIAIFYLKKVRNLIDLCASYSSHVTFKIISYKHSTPMDYNINENRQKRSGPVSSVHQKMVGYNSKKKSNFEKKQKPEKSSDKPENQAIHHFFIQNLDFKSKTAENRSTNRKNRPINRKNLLTFHFFPKFRKLNFVQKTDRFSQVSVKPVSCFQVDK
jgi:hypothetical protein